MTKAHCNLFFPNIDVIHNGSIDAIFIFLDAVPIKEIFLDAFHINGI